MIERFDGILHGGSSSHLLPKLAATGYFIQVIKWADRYLTRDLNSAHLANGLTVSDIYVFFQLSYFTN